MENLLALGGQVMGFGAVGHDETAEQIVDLPDGRGADATEIVSDPGRKSTRKARLMSLEHGQQVFRMDAESAHPVSADVEDHLVRAIQGLTSIHAVICSDYMKGTLTRRVLNTSFTYSRKLGIPGVVGPKDPNSQKYHGAAILMPNAKELTQLTSFGKGGTCLLTTPLKP